MLSYNDDSIFVGYIKQILSSFNYPSINIYRPDIILIKDCYYIYKDNIVKYNGTNIDSSDIIAKYFSDKKYLNLTKEFINQSLLYDTHTHIWLGKYLRFLKDYKNIDLMSMYNYFTQKVAENIDIDVGGGFDSDNSNYTLYDIPVYLFEKYSIYLEDTGRVELICTLGRDKSDNLESSLRTLTYNKINNPRFNNAIIFDCLYSDKLKNFSELKELYANRENIRLILKVPSTLKSSIVILQGVYPNSNDFIIPNDDDGYQKNFLLKTNHSVTNYEYIKDGELNNNLISPKELIRMNTAESHPFATRLMEYLSENAITLNDDVSDNIKRVQKRLQERYNEHELGMKSYGNNYGIWIPEMTNTLYDIEVKGNRFGQIYDILGYVDKDVEKMLGEDVDIYGGNDL